MTVQEGSGAEGGARQRNNVPLEGEPRYAVTRYRYDGNGNRTGIVTPEEYRILRSSVAPATICSGARRDDKNESTGRHQSPMIMLNITRIVRSGKGLGMGTGIRL